MFVLKMVFAQIFFLYHLTFILATNIAETSITIPDVANVIDFCLVKQANCVEEEEMIMLKLIGHQSKVSYKKLADAVERLMKKSFA
jgi:Helicase conserved C-terminal domain